MLLMCGRVSRWRYDANAFGVSVFASTKLSAPRRGAIANRLEPDESRECEQARGEKENSMHFTNLYESLNREVAALIIGARCASTQ
jgi:hypothetical protein